LLSSEPNLAPTGERNLAPTGDTNRRPSSDPLRAAALLRREHPDWSAGFASAVATQRDLGSRAREAGTVPTEPWLLTRTGVEQSTRPAIAKRRAAHLAAAGVASVVDLTAGLGIDSWACTQAGLQVLALERDELTAELCRANVPAAQVMCADATRVLEEFSRPGRTPDLPKPICWLVDPSRRGSRHPIDGRRAAPERDPQRWSPPWAFVEQLRIEHEWVAAKAPGGFSPAAHWSAEWVGFSDYVAECALYSMPISPLQHFRQATLLGSARESPDVTLPAYGNSQAPIGPLDTYIGEPHPVFHESLTALCSQGAHRVGEPSNWLTAPTANIAGVRWFRVLDIGPLKKMGSAARGAGITAVALKSRESPVPQATLRKRAGLPDGNRYAIIFPRGMSDVVLAERVADASAQSR